MRDSDSAAPRRFWRAGRVRWSPLAGGCVAIAAAVSFAGWRLDLPRLTDWLGLGVSIQPNTAVAAFAAGVAALAWDRRRVRGAMVAGAICAAIGAATLLEHVAAVDLGIDGRLRFDRPWGDAGTLAPGRMGVPSALSWALLGIGWIAAAGGVRSRRTAAVTAFAAVTIGSLSVIGALLGARPLYTIPWLTTIALQTSCMIIVAGLGLLAALPDREPMRSLHETGSTGSIARRALFFVVAVPIVLGWLSVQGWGLGLYDAALGVALLVVALILAMGAGLWWCVVHIATRERDLDASRAVRERAQAEVRTSEARLASILERIPLGVGLLDEAGRWMLMNAALRELIGEAETTRNRANRWRGFDEAGRPLDRDQWPGIRALKGESVVPGALFLLGDPGVVRHMLVSAVPLRDASETISGAIVTVEDVDDRIRAARALQDADRKKDEFLAVMAHELRNPLAPIRNSLEALKLAGGDVEQQRWIGATMERHVEHLVRLVDDLLDVSRITNDQLALHTETLELRSVLENAIESLRPAFEKLGHRLEAALPDGIVVKGDGVRLTQVFCNLLDNAAKFTESPGRTRIELSQVGAEARVLVQDDGIGIAPDRLAEIFGLFTRIGPTLERRQDGLGIGLSLVKRLVELHGGSIVARSPGLGKGSEFEVRLPLGHPAERAAQVANGPTAEAPRRRILVVDDHVDSAQSLSKLLEIAGHETCVAHSADEALERAPVFRPEVILLDIGLPGMNGYDACRAIRRQAWGPAVRIVALTGWGQDADRCRSREAGFDAHLVKPVDYATLRSLLAAPADG